MTIAIHPHPGKALVPVRRQITEEQLETARQHLPPKYFTVLTETLGRLDEAREREAKGLKPYVDFSATRHRATVDKLIFMAEGIKSIKALHEGHEMAFEALLRESPPS